MDIPYIETVEDMGLISRKELNPTGKWKISSGPYYKGKIFIEHKGWFFKRWISEDSIIFAPPKTSEVFDCEICCPVCGYYCLGNGGHGCIDKPSMVKWK